MELPRRVGERVVRALQEFDGAAIEELFSDGLLNVMAAPEFAQSEKLRRVFAALENRAYLAELIGGVAGSRPRVRLHRLREPGRGDGGRLASSWPRTGSPAAPSASSASWGPPAWPIRRRSAPSASCPA